MKPHDLTAQAESDSRSFWFGCKERNEDLINNITEYALSVVYYLNCDPASFIDECLDHDFRIRLVAKRLNGIFYHVDQNLLEQLLVGRKFYMPGGTTEVIKLMSFCLKFFFHE
jgi:hypothetical protein